MAGAWLFKVTVHAGENYYQWYGFEADKSIAVMKAQDEAFVKSGIYDEEGVHVTGVQALSQSQIYFRFRSMKLLIQVVDEFGDEESRQKMNGPTFFNHNMDEPEIIWKLTEQRQNDTMRIPAENNRSIWIMRIDRPVVAGPKIKSKSESESESESES